MIHDNHKMNKDRRRKKIVIHFLLGEKTLWVG